MAAKEYITVLKDYAAGAVVETIQIEMKTDKPIHEIYVTMTCDADTDLPTIAEMLTQFATTITVKSGGASVVGMSAIDLWKMMSQARPAGIAAHQSDGTGADNHIHPITIPIPLGPIGVFDDVHPDYGLDPRNKTVIVQLEIPADAAITERFYTIGFVSIEGKYPTKVVTRMTRTFTAAATGEGMFVDLPSGPDSKLIDVAFFQTTSLQAGSTTDATGIESFSLEINNVEKHLVDVLGLQLQTNTGNLSLAASSPRTYLTYLYWNPSPPNSDEYAIPLPQTARININAGVAEALRFFGGVTRKL